MMLLLECDVGSNDLLEEFHGGFKENHSTETALVRITNDLMVAADCGLLNILFLLDLTAAFDIECHKTPWQ